MKQSRTRSFAANIIIIFTAQIAVKLLGMLYRMVITNIDGFGDAGNGFYSAGFQIYTLLLAVSSIGIPNAVSKLISEKAAAADYAGTQKIFKTSLLIFAAIGALLSIGLFAFSVPIAKYIINMDGAEYTMAALAPSIFFVCVLSVFRGYFSGVNRMNVMSASQVIEQIFKSVLTVLFVLAAQGLPPEIMSGWANLATTAATVLSTLYLLFMYKADGRREAGAEKAEVRRGFFSAAKEILMIAVPISLCSVISAVNRIIDTATITRGIERAFGAYIPAHGAAGAVYAPTAAQLSDEAVRLAGMLSKSDTLLNLPLALNIAFATVLVPYISKCRVVGDSLRIKEYINFSLLTSVVLVLPCAAGYIALARPIFELIYPNAPLGYELLQLSAISLVFTALSQTVTGALQGLGKVHLSACALAVGCVIKTVLNYILIAVPQINIYGAVIGTISCQLAVFVIELAGLYKFAGGLSFKGMLVKPLVCCTIMFLAACFIYERVYSLLCSNAAALIISIAISAVLYLILILRFRIFTAEQLKKIPGLNKICTFFNKSRIQN